MPTIGYLLRVMIASPGDVSDHRDAVESALHEWNRVNSSAQQIALLPWRWETSAIPVMGEHPQSLLNKQGVDQSDIIIALFGSRLGTPTPEAISGTVEEIERAVAARKPVHLYFFDGPIPNDVDTRQLDALRSFRASVQDRGLYLTYSDIHDLRGRVSANRRHFDPFRGVLR